MGMSQHMEPNQPLSQKRKLGNQDFMNQSQGENFDNFDNFDSFMDNTSNYPLSNNNIKTNNSNRTGSFLLQRSTAPIMPTSTPPMSTMATTHSMNTNIMNHNIKNESNLPNLNN